MKLLLLALIIFSFNVTAQKLPVDKVSGNVFYAEEVLVKDGPQTDLYHRAKAWLHSFDKGKTQPVLTTDALADGVIVGSQYTLVTVPTGQGRSTYKLWFILQLKLDDDRYWYRLDNFQLQMLPVSSTTAIKKKAAHKYPLEEVLFGKYTSAKKGISVSNLPLLEKECDQAISALIQNLKKSML